MVEDTAGEAQHDICAAPDFAAVPMRTAYAERYAGQTIISSLSWASHNLMIPNPVATMTNRLQGRGPVQ